MYQTMNYIQSDFSTRRQKASFQTFTESRRFRKSEWTKPIVEKALSKPAVVGTSLNILRQRSASASGNALQQFITAVYNRRG